MGAEASTVILVPVLARPHRVAPLLDAVWETTNEPHRVLFVVSRTDHVERRELERLDAEHLVVDEVSYPAKINAGYRATSEPWLFLAADDISPHVGWLTEALRVAAETGARVIGTNDLGNARTVDGTHSTHSLVARAYADDPGATADHAREVLHEGYRHWYCDDELVSVAKARGEWAHAGDAIVEHLHPYHGKAERDDVYTLGEANRHADGRLFRRRARIWRRW